MLAAHGACTHAAYGYGVHAPVHAPILHTRAAARRARVSLVTCPTVASPSTPLRDVHIAFSGGGFFSHSVLSGLVSGIIDHQLGGLENPDYETQLEQLFGRTKTITSNSGGSWFMSQLAYSPTFQSMFEATRLDWDSPAGYLGQAELYMGVAGCPLSANPWGTEMCNTFGNNIYMLAYFGMDWERVVGEGVHGPWGISAELDSKSLRSDPAYQASIRNRWARDINLSYAATISTGKGDRCDTGSDGAATYIAKSLSGHTRIHVTRPYASDWANEPVHLSSWVSPGPRPRFSREDLEIKYRYGNGAFGGGFHFGIQEAFLRLRDCEERLRLAVRRVVRGAQ